MAQVNLLSFYEAVSVLKLWGRYLPAPDARHPQRLIQQIFRGWEKGRW
ncbi:hypothetical protein SACS_0993 [Parasaccharibacter apium]|uniref:Uncharacterized protein n=1 Tax=Parasaccharibacter apium TaxID=1510841 RepID=A0A7U7G5Y4_9PROT|nr:hypothetical protein SACS_0993 [Parasaccharibacter apium]